MTVGADAFPPLHPDAVALSAFRVLPNGEGRAYTIAEAESGRNAIDHILRMARACGYVTPSAVDDDSYAVLDVLDDEDAIVQDFAIPTAAAFRWWKRKLHLSVSS